MDSLPQEILDTILLFCDTRSIIRFSKTNKKYNRVVYSSIVWKYKTLIEYNIKLLSNKFTINNSFYSIYKKVYLRQCIHCNKNTNSIELFYKIRACSACQRSLTKYHKISATSCQKKYFLKKYHLENIRNICKTISFYGKKKNTVWYLEEDVIKYVNTLYTHNQFLEMRKKRVRVYINKLLKRHYKFVLLRTYILDIYNIDIIPYVRYADTYSDKLYSRYLTCKPNDADIFQQIIYKFIELHYINITRGITDSMIHYFFEHMLLQDMLAETDPDINIPYILECKQDILNKYNELFIRRDDIKHHLRDVTGWSFEDYSVREYIYGNNRTNSKSYLEDIKLNYKELEFFRNNSGILFFDNFLFKREIPILLDAGIEVPKWILDRHNQLSYIT